MTKRDSALANLKAGAAVKRGAKPGAKSVGHSKESSAFREQLFVSAMLANGCNKTQAAITAGYSERTAGQKGLELSKRPNVIHMLSAAQVKMAKKHDLTADSVIAELSKIVHADTRKLFGEDGRLLHPKDWPDEMAGAVASVEVDELFEGTGKDRKWIGYTKKVKLWDKNSGIEKAMKYLGLFERDNSQKLGVLESLPRDVLQAIVARLSNMGQGNVIDGHATRA